MLGAAGGRRATVQLLRSCRQGQGTQYRQGTPGTARRMGGLRLPNTEYDNLTLMVFGSSTDVGKTIVSAGISAAALKDKKKVCYIKPVQTGDMDEYFVQLYTNPHGNADIYFRTLNHWKTATSPHIAATLEGKGGGESRLRSDDELLQDLASEIGAFEQSTASTSTSSAEGKAPMGGDRHTRLTVVETAGGVLSPGPNKTLQADLYRPLRLPLLLVGDARLGGISTTLCAYESLRLRGYTVHAIALIDQHYSQPIDNAAYLREQLQHTYGGGEHSAGDGLPFQVNAAPLVVTLSALPGENSQLLNGWFRDNEAAFHSLYCHITDSVERGRQQQEQMAAEGARSVWWPFTQHAHLRVHHQLQAEGAAGAEGAGAHTQNPDSSSSTDSSSSSGSSTDSSSGSSGSSTSSGTSSSSVSVMPSGELTFIDSAHGDFFRTVSMEAVGGAGTGAGGAGKGGLSGGLRVTGEVDMFDGCASWWTQAVGHGNSAMSLAVAEAAGRYGHVMFPRNLHAPAVVLSRFLLSNRGKHIRVFFSDDGSTAMEIAMKMAFRLSEARSPSRPGAECIVLSQAGAYHGDTLGTMNTAPASVFNAAQHPWYDCRARVLQVPTVSVRRGQLCIDAEALDDPQIASALSLPESAVSSRSSLLDMPMRIKDCPAL
ncbi:AAA domain-containing protein, partial [Ochromonadaceae sp. CCMP2298]